MAVYADLRNRPTPRGGMARLLADLVADVQANTAAMEALSDSLEGLRIASDPSQPQEAVR